MNTRNAIFPALATLALLAPVACDDPALVVDENLLLSDDPDEVDAAFDGGADELAAGLDPALVANNTSVWGVEFNGTDTRLFRHNLDGMDAALAPVVLKYNAANAQIDGLAQSSGGTLYGFVISGTTSQLVSITAAGVATKIGSAIASSQIRGAAFNAAGALLAIDVTTKQLRTISITTGQPVASSALKLNGVAFTPSADCDLAQAPDGGLRLVNGSTVYTLATTGALTLPVALSTAYSLTGATFNPATPGGPDQLVALNNKTADSLVRANLRTKAVAVVRTDVIPGHDATRGDLASKPFACTTAAAIPNGSFEQPDVPGYTTYSMGSTAITGWTISLGTVDVVDTSLFQSSHSAQSLDLNGVTKGSVSLAKFVATTSGRTYRLAFAMAGNPDLAGVKTMQVFATGGSVRSYSFDSTGKTRTNMGWRQDDYFFKAGASTGLQFTSMLEGASGPFLDNVRLFQCTL